MIGSPFPKAVNIETLFIASAAKDGAELLLDESADMCNGIEFVTSQTQ